MSSHSFYRVIQQIFTILNFILYSIIEHNILNLYSLFSPANFVKLYVDLFCFYMYVHVIICVWLINISFQFSLALLCLSVYIFGFSLIFMCFVYLFNSF